MPIESFFETLVINTPEAAARLNELVESGVKWTRGDSTYTEVDGETFLRMWEEHKKKKIERERRALCHGYGILLRAPRDRLTGGH